MAHQLLDLAATIGELGWLYLQLYWLRADMLSIRVLAWLVSNPHEAIGAVFGLAGAALLATKGRWASLGWIAFLGSNVAWIWFALHADHPGLLIQQLGFTITTLIGLWVWLIKPRLHGLPFGAHHER